MPSSFVVVFFTPSLHIRRASNLPTEEVAKDYNSNWLTAIEAVEDWRPASSGASSARAAVSSTYLLSDSSFNLLTVSRSVGAASEEERAHLETVGQFHCGEFINAIRAGSLVMNLSEPDEPAPAPAASASASSSSAVTAAPAAPWQRVVPSHLFGSSQCSLPFLFAEFQAHASLDCVCQSMV